MTTSRLSLLQPEEVRRVYRRVVADVDPARGVFRRAELTTGVHREAERLLLGLGPGRVLRAADALHLTLAALVGARVLVTYDGRLRDAAHALGTLEVV